MELGIVVVAGRVSAGLFPQIAAEGRLQIDTTLVREADDDEQNIRQFIRQIADRFPRLGRLLAASPGEDPSDLTHLFDELGEVRQFAEVADSDRLDPVIDLTLGFGNGQLAGRVVVAP